MNDSWIVEADIYRLKKALWHCSEQEERLRLERLLLQKQRRLGAMRMRISA